jgi:hypothetical protein
MRQSPGVLRLDNIFKRGQAGIGFIRPHIQTGYRLPPADFCSCKICIRAIHGGPYDGIEIALNGALGPEEQAALPMPVRGCLETGMPRGVLLDDQLRIPPSDDDHEFMSPAEDARDGFLRGHVPAAAGL